jgi:hypothetical protein
MRNYTVCHCIKLINCYPLINILRSSRENLQISWHIFGIYSNNVNHYSNSLKPLPMFLRNLLAVILVLIGIICSILLIVFLTSAAIFGSFFLPLICVIGLTLFFYFMSLWNEKQEI